MAPVLAKPDIVLIDLDGTLVDSVPDLAWCCDQMLMHFGLPACGEANVRQWVGNGVEKLIKRALTGDMDGEPDKALLAKAKPVFMALYRKHSCHLSQLYPGVESGLDWLAKQGIRLGCVTNKDEAFTLPILDTLNIGHFFELVVSGDSLAQKKPHPAPLLNAADFFGVTPDRALMIGDSVSDVKASRAAGFRIICTSYGYNHGVDIRSAQPDAVIDSLAELESLFL
jgi:phosphoglycolate phosphatase